MKAVELKRVFEIGGWVGEVGQYTKRLTLWAHAHFLPAIVVFLSIVFGFFLIDFFSFSEPGVRFVGLLFQIASLFPVLLGIREVMRIFDHPTIWVAAKEAWRTRPRWKAPPVTFAASATFEGFAPNVTMTQRKNVSVESSVPERIEALEFNLKQIEAEAFQFRAQINQSLSKTNENVNTVMGDHAAQINDISHKLRSANIDGIGWAIAGVVWIALGIVLSTESIEIHDALGTSRIHASGVNHAAPAVAHKSSGMF